MTPRRLFWPAVLALLIVTGGIQPTVHTLPSQALAQDPDPPVPLPVPAPEPKITAENVFDGITLPTHVRPTGFALISIDGCKAEQIRWKLGPTCKCVDEAQATMVELNSKTWQLWVNLDGKGSFTLALYGIFEGEPCCRLHRITVGSEPAPGPVPPPAPLPPGKYGLAQFAYDEAMKVAASSRSKSSQFADAFESTSAAIAAGTISDGDAALAKLRTDVAPLKDAAWVPFFDAWASKLMALDSDGKVVTVQDLAEALSETATGLRAVR